MICRIITKRRNRTWFRGVTGAILWCLAGAANAVAEPAQGAPGAVNWLNGLALALSGLSILIVLGMFGLYLYRSNRRAHSNVLRALAAALDQVDLFGDAKPAVQFQGRGQPAEVARAIDNLLTRVDRYKKGVQGRERRMRRLMSSVSDVLFQTDAELRLTWVAESVSRVLGYSSEALLGRYIYDLLIDTDEVMSAFRDRAQLANYPVRFAHFDGSVAWLLVTARRLQDADGQYQGTEGLFRDGTDLVEAEQALSKERSRAHVTLASIADGVITTSVDGIVDYMNPSAERLLGKRAGQAMGRHFDDVCKLLENDTRVPVSGLLEQCAAQSLDDRVLSEITIHNARTRTDFSVRVSISSIHDDNSVVIGQVIVLHDITELHEISRQMSHQATHDSLTGLANRQAFEQALEELLNRDERRDQHHALCYLDLDQFKIVNDTSGHAAGDELLRQISAQLAGQLRDSDFLARLGGDEFGVILRDTTLERATQTAERMCRSVEEFRFTWGKNLFRVGVSIGLVPIGRGSAGSCAQLLSYADTACYKAKNNGRNQVHVHLPGSEEAASHDSDMKRLQQLTDAMENNGLALFVQEIRSAHWKPGNTIGFESLVRMYDDNGRLLRPSEFLPTAERYDVMPRIDRWVFDNTLDALATPTFPSALVESISINLSGQALRDEHFISFALKKLTQTDIDTSKLIFEITETSAITNLTRATTFIRQLRDMGCRFALDDFGGGLSSFSYLKTLPLDMIKIDGTFVRDIARDPVDLETVKAINQVGHTMGLQTIAESVESEAILKTLQQIGVDYVQGHYIARPIPIAELRNSIFLSEQAIS